MLALIQPWDVDKDEVSWEVESFLLTWSPAVIVQLNSTYFEQYFSF